MKNSYFIEILEELQSGAIEKGHPFRYFTLATMGVDTVARLRTVVLRNVSEDLKLTFYTDRRSKKIIHIKENNKVSLLFYHPKKLWQLRIEGIASIVRDPDIKRKYWENMEARFKKDYTTSAAPGSVIEDPDSLEYLEEADYFCIVAIQPFRIEYLKLNHPNHLKIRFLDQGNNWKSEFLVP